MNGVIDFTTSYLTFFGANEGNIARCQLDAACTIYDEAADTPKIYYLIVPCRGKDGEAPTA